MEASRVRALRFASLQVVGAVAIVHLVVGGTNLLRIAAGGLLGPYLTGYVVADPRPLLFFGSGVAILAGVVLTARGRLPYRLAYQLGILALLTYVVGWLGWHTVLNHGLALSASASGPTADHSHAGLLGTLHSHYVEPILATLTASTEGTPGTGRVLLSVLSVTLELVGVVLLGVLLRVDPEAESDTANPFGRAEDAGSD
jgi:hypothetical protein